MDTVEPARLAQHLQRVEEAYYQARKCMSPTIGQHGPLQVAERDSFLLLLRQKCPATADYPELVWELLCE